MHCPSCGQQQVSSETKFCSRCGLPLSVVAEVVSHGGYLPQLAELNQKTTKFTRRNGAWFSLIWFIFFLLIVTPFWGIMNVEELAAISAITGIFGGLLILISSLIFLKKPYVSYMHPYQAAPPQQMYGHGHQGSLPPQQSVPASSYAAPRPGTWRDTNDLEPASVTESTTRLLGDEERR